MAFRRVLEETSERPCLRDVVRAACISDNRTSIGLGGAGRFPYPTFTSKPAAAER